MTRTVLRLLWYWGPLVAYAAGIYVLSSMPVSIPAPLRFPHADKVAHIIEYSGLGVLLCRALALGGEGLTPKASIIATCLIAALYGLSDELHQALVPYRISEVGDFLADVFGGTLGALVYWRLRLRAHVARRSAGT